MRANVSRLRDVRNLGYAELSRRVKAAGRSIPELGLRRIEEGRRRVDADDLMALAEALEVWPIALLMPHATAEGATVQTGDELVQATGHSLMSARIFWNMLRGKLIRGIGATTEPTLKGTADYRRFINSTPGWAVEDDLDALRKTDHGND